VKIVADAEELESLEGLSDADLVKLVRDGFSKFRRGRDSDPDAEDDETDEGGLRHGAPSKATLETQGSRSGNVNPGGATDSAMAAATRAAALQAYDARLREDERTAEAAKLIPGYGRL
jgi:hypothetical protein